MTRSARPRPARLRAAIIVCTVGASMLTGAATAQATPNVTDLEATILRIGGAAVTGTDPVPAGRTLTRVRLSTADPASTEGDALRLSGATASFRIGGTTVPGTPAEQATFRIDGTTVSTTVPDMRGASLQTDGGVVPVVVFTASGATYAIPRSSTANVTRTVARSAVNSSTVGGIATHEYGLLPVGTKPQLGTAFSTQAYDSTVLSAGTTRHTVLDADGVRRNADAPGEELVAVGEPRATYAALVGTVGDEVLATVTLRHGSTVTVLGLLYLANGPYSEVRRSWFFDRAALAAAGATVADVTAVVSSAPTDHSLTWQELGFDLV